MTRRIAAATFSRAEAGSLLPVLRAIDEADDLELFLIAGGSHLESEHGRTVSELEEAGFSPAACVEMLDSSTTPESAGAAIGRGTIALSRVLAESRADLLLVVGDRYELLSPVSAALPLRLPVAHVSGGDVTEGAFDNLVRQAVSALSHLHFVAMQEHAERLRRSGEEHWRIFVTGEPALDAVRTLQPMTRQELERVIPCALDAPVIVATLHPTTLGREGVGELDALLGALAEADATIVCTAANADPGGDMITERLRAFCEARDRAAFVTSLGQRAYHSLLQMADVMVGNSSSRIWEAPSFRLPVVNVGDRQKGRTRAQNVIDVAPDAEAIERGLSCALDPRFRETLVDLENPYGDGAASPRIVEVLRSVELGVDLLRKRFAEAVSVDA
jgi:GDP/UDP-N,N'-diacetylbacillosamine 2-epimerase (hydrolysing)